MKDDSLLVVFKDCCIHIERLASHYRQNYAQATKLFISLHEQQLN